MLSERKTLTEAQRPVQIEDPNLARSDEAVESHLPCDHHRWAIPVDVILAVVLTVPGPSALAEADIANRKRPPRPRTRRSAVTFPVGRSSVSARSARGRHRVSARSACGRRRLYDQLDEMDGPDRMRVQRGALDNRIKA